MHIQFSAQVFAVISNGSWAYAKDTRDLFCRFAPTD
jgi:hypothetical protein